MVRECPRSGSSTNSVTAWFSLCLLSGACVAGDLWSAVRLWGEGCDIAWQADETRVSVEVSSSPEARRTRL